MTRMLANLSKINCYNHTSLSKEFIDETLLKSAKENLLEFAFFGIVEEQKKTQFLFERTFGLRFLENFEQREKTHVNRLEITDEMRRLSAEKNYLDIKLYDFAKDLFFQRVRTLEKKLNYSVEEYFQTVRNSEEEEVPDGGSFFEDEDADEAGQESYSAKVNSQERREVEADAVS